VAAALKAARNPIRNCRHYRHDSIPFPKQCH
jgi:hypothetical protein